MQANVLKRWFPLFEQLLKETDVIGFVADVGEKVFLSLWGSYADEILDIWANKEKSGLIVVILQFGTLKYYQHSAYVNNAFNVSKLFINSEIDEITSFKNSLLQNSGLSTCSVDSSKVSGTFMSLFDEYVVNTEFNNTAEVNLSKVKQVVIVATVELIPLEIPWYYQFCKTCNRKLTKINDGGDIFDTKLVDQHVLYECKTVGCNPTAVPGSQRLKIPLTPGNSESITNTLSEIPFQETLNFKASLESTDDNVTPLSQTEQDNGKRHVGKEATFKRKLVDAYDIEDTGALSATKAISDGKKTLLVPKVEK
ncbi:hypothetical protein L1987_25473 [Smallanthus sonchifolius]|uniref:Uncharacterized protein n=1 Tax=Smallanthus sonchifolius TaxID=185202 RepID=A0ACB9IN42_9ASTR|nr:hypothetical protein L1987_25473 [Smallanthus sonchifolius]